MKRGTRRNISLWRLLGKIYTSFAFIARTPRMRLGLFLLIINVPFGYGGAALGTYLAWRLDESKWLTLGAAAYLLSWVMLALATILLGRDTKRFVSIIIRRKWRAWKTYNHKEHHHDQEPA